MNSSMERTTFDVLAELFARDVDIGLLRRSRAMTPTQRLEWLEQMQDFAESAERGRIHEAETAARTAG